MPAIVLSLSFSLHLLMEWDLDPSTHFPKIPTTVDNISPECYKGSCQVKQIPKIQEKLGLAGPHPPTTLSNFLFFGEIYFTKKTPQNNTHFPKKRRIRVGT